MWPWPKSWKVLWSYEWTCKKAAPHLSADTDRQSTMTGWQWLEATFQALCWAHDGLHPAPIIPIYFGHPQDFPLSKEQFSSWESHGHLQRGSSRNPCCFTAAFSHNIHSLQGAPKVQQNGGCSPFGQPQNTEKSNRVKSLTDFSIIYCHQLMGNEVLIQN